MLRPRSPLPRVIEYLLVQAQKVHSEKQQDPKNVYRTNKKEKCVVMAAIVIDHNQKQKKTVVFMETPLLLIMILC